MIRLKEQLMIINHINYPNTFFPFASTALHTVLKPIKKYYFFFLFVTDKQTQNAEKKYNAHEQIESHILLKHA